MERGEGASRVEVGAPPAASQSLSPIPPYCSAPSRPQGPEPAGFSAAGLKVSGQCRKHSSHAPVAQIGKLRCGEEKQPAQSDAVRGPARTDPFHSLRDPNLLDLSKEALGGRLERGGL